MSSDHRMFVPLHFRRFRRGDSLVEMLVTVFIIALVMSILAEMFLTILRSYTYYDTQGRLVTRASDMAQRLTTYANEAVGIEASRTIAGATYTSDQNTVVLKISSVDAAGNIIANTFDYVAITADPNNNTRLLEITDADATSKRLDISKLFGDTVGEYMFAYQNADPATSHDIFFMVTTQQKAGSTTVHHTIHAYAKLRNT